MENKIYALMGAQASGRATMATQLEAMGIHYIPAYTTQEFSNHKRTRYNLSRENLYKTVTPEEFAQMVAAGQNPDIPVRKFLMVKEFAKNPEARMPVRTFITGDSFMLGMVPYVFDAFPETEAYSRYYLDMDAVLEMKPEVFIYEIAERYVSELDIIPGYNTAALAE